MILCGQKFGKLLVIDVAEDYIDPKSKKHIKQYLCQCDCGTIKVIRASNLKSGVSKPCGCERLKKCVEVNRNNKKLNTYDLTGEYGIGYTSKGEEFYFDLEDYDKIKNYAWMTNKKGYICTSLQFNNKKQVLMMHNLVMNNNDNTIIIDHINHRVNDNRKEKLRVTVNGQNNMNHSLYKSNTSGCAGVTWKEKNQKWEVRISVNKKRYYLGLYDDINEAIKVRKKAEEKYFGEYSYDNSIKAVNI